MTKCPYFISEDGTKIECTGYIKSAHMVISFQKRSQKEEYMNKLCCSENWSKCIYALIKNKMARE